VIAYEIKSLKALQKWLVTESTKSTEWYAGPHPCRSKCLLLSAASSIDFRWDSWTVQHRPLHRIVLPATKDARAWWLQIWEGEIIGGYFLVQMNILALAKGAVWKALPDRYLVFSKQNFKEIDVESAIAVIGKAEFYTMQAEAQYCGMSTRMLKHEVAEILQRQLSN
jgi:hypothetical protein